jgi:hypothetical protein
VKNYIIAALSMLISSEVLAQDLFYKKGVFSQFESQVEKNQIINDRNTIGEYPIVKTGEEMRAVFSKVNYSTGVSVPLGRVAMFSQKDKKLLFAVDVTANLSQASSSDWVDEPCKREDFIWKRSTGKSIKDVNCVSINHIVNYFVNPTGAFQQILVWSKDEGIEIPPTIIRVTFTRYAPDMRRLVHTVDINPEQYGLSRDPTLPWGSNGWHKNFINRDQKRFDFIENVKKWAIDIQDRMDAAFKKDANAFVDARKLNAYLDSSVTVEKDKSILEIEKVEVNLARLKGLFEKGLLTEIQYNEQVKDILNTK